MGWIPSLPERVGKWRDDGDAQMDRRRIKDGQLEVSVEQPLQIDREIIELMNLLSMLRTDPFLSRKGNPYDNAVMESFNATYQRECGGLTEERGGYATRVEATADFFDYVEKYYNRERRHSALGCQTPVDFENQLQ